SLDNPEPQRGVVWAAVPLDAHRIQFEIYPVAQALGGDQLSEAALILTRHVLQRSWPGIEELADLIPRPLLGLQVSALTRVCPLVRRKTCGQLTSRAGGAGHAHVAALGPSDHDHQAPDRGVVRGECGEQIE